MEAAESLRFETLAESEANHGGARSFHFINQSFN